MLLRKNRERDTLIILIILIRRRKSKYEKFEEFLIAYERRNSKYSMKYRNYGT